MSRVLDGACHIVEISGAGARLGRLDADGIPAGVAFFDPPCVSPLGRIMPASVRRVDTGLDLIFCRLETGAEGVINRRRAKLFPGVSERLKGKPIRRLSDAAQEGQSVLVQVLAEPSEAGKALSLTPKPRLTGRYAGVERASSGKGRLTLSKDIAAKTARTLQQACGALATDVVVTLRPAAGNVSPAIATAEIEALAAIARGTMRDTDCPHTSTLGRALAAIPPGDTPVVMDGLSAASEIRDMAAKLYPDLVSRLTPHSGGALTAFEEAELNEMIEAAEADTHALPSGGNLRIEAGGALSVMDVNLGTAAANLSAQEAIRRTNLEAALAAAHHLAFQNIGGLIVIDFIDTNWRKAADELLTVLDSALADDTIPTDRTGISKFGLVELSRGRSTRPLSQRVRRIAHSAQDSLRKWERTAKPGSTLTVAAPIAAYLQERPALFGRLETLFGQHVRFDGTSFHLG